MFTGEDMADQVITETTDQGDEIIVVLGDAIKATRTDDGVTLGGYLVRFGSAQDTDISEYKDFFTSATDFDIEDWPGRSTVYFNHGLDPALKQRKLGKATLTVDDAGVWAETILKERDEYEKMLTKLAEAGKLGWSSGTASHLVEREPEGKAHRITRWPLGLDASLTHTPAEPRNVVLPLKSLDLGAIEPEDTATEPEPEAATMDAAGDESATKAEPIGGIEMELTEERLQELMGAAVTAALKSLPADNTKAGGVVVTKDEADQDFGSAGDFFKAVKNAAIYPQSEDVRLKGLKATGMSEGIPADGGYLLPKQVAAGISDRMLNEGMILSRVSLDAIQANTMAYNGIDETTHVGSVFGGVIPYWVAEAGTITGSKPKFWQLELKLKKVAAMCYATDEQLEDTPALASWLNRNVPSALRFSVEEAIYNGDGVGKPLGIMNSPCLVSVTRIDANEVDATDIANMWSRRYAGVNDYVWLANSAVYPQLVNLVVGQMPVFLPAGGVAGLPYATIYGRPVIETEYSAALGTTGDIMLASLSQYQAITKSGGIKADSSIHVAYTTAETAFRFQYRIDGAPLWNTSVTPLRGNAFGPFVVLTAAT